MSTALRIRFRLSLSLSLSRVHISFGFLFFGCNYIYFWGSPAFPSFRLDATAFFTRFFLIYFWLAPVFFFLATQHFRFRCHIGTRRPDSVFRMRMPGQDPGIWRFVEPGGRESPAY